MGSLKGSIAFLAGSGASGFQMSLAVEPPMSRKDFFVWGLGFRV